MVIGKHKLYCVIPAAEHLAILVYMRMLAIIARSKQILTLNRTDVEVDSICKPVDHNTIGVVQDVAVSMMESPSEE